MEPWLVALGVGLLGAIVWDHVRLSRAIVTAPASPPRLDAYPSVTVIRPIRGLDVNARANVDALLRLDYPGRLALRFVFDDFDDPAYPVVRDAVRAWRQEGGAREIALVEAGPTLPGRTGKLNAMIVGMRQARGELVAFSDSDTRPAPSLLRRLVEILVATPDAGCTFAPVLVGDPARSAGDVGYALLMNAWYGPSVARAAGADRALPFIMGQLMLFRRQALEAVGGVACAEGQLVDDMYIGRQLAAAGWRNVMSIEPLHISTGGMTAVEFARLFRRWLLFSRNGLPLRFTGPNWMRGIVYWSALLAAVAGAQAGLLAGAVPAVALFASAADQIQLHRRFGGAPISWRHAWVAVALPLVAPLLVASTFVSPTVDWRGRPYRIDNAAQLRAEPPEHAAEPLRR